VNANHKELAYNDLFLADSLHAFIKLSKQAFFEKHSLNAEKSLSEQGFWFENDEFKPNENFMLTAEGLTLFFNAYEVAPYVVGSTRLVLPWNQLRPLLKPDFLIEISDK
jgi:hypothetical protein